MDGDSGVEIVVDVRERALSDALAGAVAAGMVVSHASLELGDVEIRGGGRVLLLERKTLADFAASIKDGRYREQKARLLASGRAADTVFVLESFSRFAFDAGARGASGGLSPKVLSSAVVSTVVRDGFRAVWTRDVLDTAAFVVAAAAKLAQTAPLGAKGYAVVACDVSVRSKKRDNVTPDQCFLQQLCQLPGVSAKTACHLRDAFRSMAELYAELSPMTGAQRVARLAEVPLIGAKSGERIASYLFQDCA